MNYRVGLSIIAAGFGLWLIGVLLPIFLPVLAAIGAVFTLAGEVLFWLGIVILIVYVVVAIVRGTL